MILALGLVAAFGRAIQLKAFGPVSPLSHTLLEIVIESSRILLFLYVLGLSNIRSGFLKILHLFTNKPGRRQTWHTAIRTIRGRWLALLINLGVFACIAFLFNLFIDHIAYQTCLLLTLKDHQVVDQQSSAWTVILFFKNLSVIPFTIVFEVLFLLWLTNRLPKSVAYSSFSK
ncbi:Npt1/Npt2 family nucleotide transporter [Rhodocytophaga aerolata]|nr:Npt1/Npt2 family nucleotide transporter [Rhodocytophaga aerolata]